MLVTDVEKVLSDYKPGTYIRITWERDISSAKARKNGVQIVKQCSGTFRTGINYANVVKDIQNVETTSDYVSWFEHCGKGLLQSKQNAEKKYVQLFTTNNHKTHTQLKINDIESDESFQLLYEKGLITKANLPNTRTDIRVFTLNIDNITQFGTIKNRS